MSENVRLRPVREEELDDLLRFLWDPDACGEFQWFGYRVQRANELKSRWLIDGLVDEQDSSFLTVALESGPPCGWVTWRPVGQFQAYEIGIALFPEHRGRGIGSAAQRLLVSYLFNVTSAHRIPAGTELENVAEQRALKAVGFLREGVRRGVYFRNGKWRDDVLYSLLRHDQAGSEQA